MPGSHPKDKGLGDRLSMRHLVLFFKVTPVILAYSKSREPCHLEATDVKWIGFLKATLHMEENKIW